MSDPVSIFLGNLVIRISELEGELSRMKETRKKIEDFLLDSADKRG